MWLYYSTVDELLLLSF